MTQAHREFRVFGPPGCGKTTWVADQVVRALEKYDPLEVVCASFTKAAAVELGGHETGLPSSNVGTVHSLCYQAMGAPDIVEASLDLCSEWNSAFPQWAIAGKADLDERQGGGDVLQLSDALNEYNMLRATLGEVDPNDPFVVSWEAFKADNEAVDFCDLLLNAPPEIDAKVLFIDEAQDNTPLQWQVVRQWGDAAETFVVAGDDDQMIYGFIGADVETFLLPLPEDRIRVLGQSYRLPRAVYEYAEAWISKLGDRRQPKAYAPRDADGVVAHHATWCTREPEPLVEAIGARAEAGQSVMVLASCAYMLQPVLTALRTAGVPFGNLYRPQRGDWNPLRRTGARLAAFLRCSRSVVECSQTTSPTFRLQRAPDWWEWVEMVRVDGALQPGAKAEIKSRAVLWPHGNSDIGIEDLGNWLTADLVDALLEGNATWLYQHVTQRFSAPLAYPLAILGAHGSDALIRAPAVTVGTIHSVKGAEADVVYLAPDLSRRTMEALEVEGQPAKDGLTRLFYVGMTRAKEELHLLQSSGAYYVNW